MPLGRCRSLLQRLQARTSGGPWWPKNPKGKADTRKDQEIADLKKKLAKHEAAEAGMEVDEDDFMPEEPKEDTAALTKKLEQNNNCLKMLKAMHDLDEAYIQRVAGKINEIKARLEAAQPASQRLSALEKSQNQRKNIRTSENVKSTKGKLTFKTS